MVNVRRLATLDAGGDVPADQLGNAPGGGPPDPHTHAGADIDSGTVADARIAASLARDTEVTGAITAHEAAGDPHTGYATDAAVATAVSDHAGAANPHTAYATDADLTAHEGAGDPHPSYATDGDLTAHAATAHGLASHALDGAFHSGTSVLPTAGQKNALAGTAGTPGTGNEYVTTSDARMADARTPAAHSHVDGDLPAGLARDSEVATALSDHAAAGNPHPSYATDADLAAHEADTTAVHGIADTAVLATATSVATAVSDHAAAANPHAGYATDADLTAHEGAGNPHPSYLTPAEGDAAYQPLDADLTAIAGLATTATGRSLLAAADAAAIRTISGAEVAGAAAAAQAASQPLDSDLTAIAALTTTAFGRSLLALADAAALAAAHSHAGASTTYAPGSFAVADGNYAIMTRRLALTTTQRATLGGTARLRIS